jgi:para-aminobenzoate synthetase component 1
MNAKLESFPTHLPFLKEISPFCLLLDPISRKAQLGLGKRSEFVGTGQGDLQRASDYLEGKRAFGFLSYELKNQVENLNSLNPKAHDIPSTYWFEPEVIFEWEDGTLSTVQGEDSGIFEQIMNAQIAPPHSPELELRSSISKEEYITALNSIHEHLQRGDIYEVNFCQQFTYEVSSFDPLQAFHQLMEKSPMPFSALFRVGDFYGMCASPERFLKRDGRRLFSDPIKGSLRRSSDAEEDAQLQEKLRTSAKDRSENIMIVDLVRNDLSKIAAKGSVRVEALNELHSFPGIHQLISRVACELKENVSFADILRSTFPMGSMTGAPKVSAMKIIEEEESFARELFSGSIGYHLPNGDFDLNVVIRSMFHSADTKKLSYSAGGAITILSEPEAEYEESLLKLATIKRLLGR